MSQYGEGFARVLLKRKSFNQPVLQIHWGKQNMGYQKYLKELWNKPKENFGVERWRTWLVQLRKEPILIRVEHPTRLDRARNLGFKAKQGYLVIRSRVRKGGRKRPRPGHGRRQAHYGRFFTTGSSLQAQAERHVTKKYPNCEVLNSYWVGEDGKYKLQAQAERHVTKKYPNCEVLNSYWVGEDGKYKWYEVILVDRDHPVIKADKKINFISNKRGRADRGLTSAGKKHRALK